VRHAEVVETAREDELFLSPANHAVPTQQANRSPLNNIGAKRRRAKHRTPLLLLTRLFGNLVCVKRRALSLNSFGLLVNW
jgi:hypothetical protein